MNIDSEDSKVDMERYGAFGDGVENVGLAVSAGRTVREYGPYGVLVGNERLKFVPAVIADPVVTGAQLLAVAGVSNPAEHLLYRILCGGLLEEIRPEETTDLRSAGAERFIIFRSDRSFRLLLNDRAVDWGAGHISGATLKQLAGVDIQAHDVWQDIRGAADRLIGDSEFSDLSEPGVERFFTKPILIKILVNARPKEVRSRVISYWEIVKLAFPEAAPSEGVIYSVDYARGPHINPEGSMVAGQHVHIKDGMTFYVTPTDRS